METFHHNIIFYRKSPFIVIQRYSITIIEIKNKMFDVDDDFDSNGKKVKKLFKSKSTQIKFATNCGSLYEFNSSGDADKICQIYEQKKPAIVCLEMTADKKYLF